MKKVILYGAGEFTKRFLQQPTNEYIVEAIADKKWKEIPALMGHSVISPSSLKKYDFDQIIIALDDLKPGNDAVIFEIYRFLLDLGIPDERILLQSFKSQEHHVNRYPRMIYLRELSGLMKERGVEGAVAECGVFRGWFASMINEYFPEKNLWLFDTFSGFDSRDVSVDSAPAVKAIENGEFDRFNYTSEEIVRLRCSHREKLIFRKGYVPDTFCGVEDTFCFVNLDMDLYAPQLAALKFFAAKMEPGGVILVHDYYNNTFTGTKQAVDEFIQIYRPIFHPIGDGLSIAIIF